MTCLEFKNTRINGDPVIPDVLFYKDDIGADPNDTRERRQAAYPGHGQLFKDIYHNMSNEYSISVSSTGFSIILGLDANPLDYPSNYSEVLIPTTVLRENMFNKELLQYAISWNNTLPYDYNNPPLIHTSFITGLVNYYNSIVFETTNVSGSGITIDVSNNISSFELNLTNYFSINNPSPEDHETLCAFIKSEVSKIKWFITETYPDPSDIDNLDTSSVINYELALNVN